MIRPTPLSLVLALVLTPTCVLGGGQPPADTTVGATQCAECHKAQVKIWEGTHHFSTFTDLPRADEARTIAEAMGIRRIKTSFCADCHFLQTLEEGEPEAVSGIACESCHGGAKGWLERHSEYSGKEDETQESEAERSARWADSEAAGMIRPANIYRLAKNCFGCHLVPREELVNAGGHAPGSDFELVAWSQGEVRHNTWASRDKVNAVPSPERLRILFVAGALVELEESLRATALGTQKAVYAVSMARRTDAARKRVKAIADAAADPELQAIAEIGMGAGLRLNNADELNAAADAVAEKTRAFLGSRDGSGLAEIDSMLPDPSAYKGTPAAVPGIVDEGAR